MGSDTHRQAVQKLLEADTMHCFPQLVVTEAMVGIEVEANRVRENNLCAPYTFGTQVQAQGKQGGNQVHVGARQAIQRPLQATATWVRDIGASAWVRGMGT